NTWYHIAVTRTGSARAIYVNGTSQNSDSNVTLGSGSQLAFGRGGAYTGIDLTGLVDEVKISNTARSGDWVRTEYNNQSAPGSFYSIGSEQSGGSSDTDPPTAPSNLTATAVSSSQINLSWTAATDNVGVTGNSVERCQGASCTNFSAIATPGAVTSY